MKKWLNILLIVILVLPILPQSNAFASSYDGGSNIVPLDQWETYKEIMMIPASYPHSITYNGNQLYFNKELFEELGVMVYGDYRLVNPNDFKEVSGGYYTNNGKRGEYRYHGYNIEKNKVTNNNFPRDSDSGRSLEDKSWIYQPWQSTSVGYGNYTRNVGHNPPLYNTTALKLMEQQDEEMKKVGNTIAKWINEGLSFNIKKTYPNNTPDKDPINYLAVTSPPTPLTSGTGVMIHKGNTNIWYQVQPIARMDSPDDKLLKPVQAEIVSIDLINMTNDSKVFNVKVTGEYMDDDVYDDSLLKTAYYIRDDIKKWYFELEESSTGKKISITEGRKSSAKKGVIDFEISIPNSTLESMKTSDRQITLYFHANAYAEMYTGARSKGIDHSSKTISGGVPVEITQTEPKDPNECIPACTEPILFSINAPRLMLDVDLFNLQLVEEDVSKAVDRYVLLNGRKLSESEESTFLSGRWKFPEIRESRVYDYSIVYVHENEELWEYTAYVVVYDSIPSAKVRIRGDHKVNRKITATADFSITSDYLMSRSNVHISEFSVTSLDGQQIYYGTNTNELKEFLVKNTGTVKIRVTVSNEYGGRTYEHEVFASPDHDPDLISILWNNNLARGESLDIFNEGASLDGDTIVESLYWIYYDEDKDEIPEKLVYSGTWTGSTPYKPNKLGTYKIVFRVKEEFGQPTIPKYITDEDKRTKTVERIFYVDNLIPMTKIYSDIEYTFPELDVAFLIDEKYPSSETEFVRDNRTSIINNFRVNSMVANVDVWDLHTYIYTQTAYKRVHSGTSRPSPTYSYNQDGYTGTLTLYNTDNFPYSVDEGEWRTKTLTKTVTMTKDSAWECGEEIRNKPDGSYDVITKYCASYSYSDSEGYSGSTTGEGYACNSYSKDGAYIGYCGGTNQPTKTGIATKTETYWHEIIVTYNDYYGDYSGQVSKAVKQQYSPSYKTQSTKYIVYMAKSNINNMNDLIYLKDIARDAKVILIGDPSLQSTITHHYFIPYSSDTEGLINKVVKYIKDENPIINELAVLVNEKFNLSYVDIDEEGDPIVEEGFQYVHDPNYFDNSLGQGANTRSSYSENGFISYKASTFAKPGKYTIYRRVKDEPIGFKELGGYSNLATLEIAVHRKPIASATLDWDFDSARGVYKTRWVDHSYDPDFQYRDANRGIVERKIKYKNTASGQWIYEIPDNLQPGTYTLEYVVMDKHGVWSDPYIMNFTLQPIPPVQLLNAQIKPDDPYFERSDGKLVIPAGEKVQLYNIQTRYPYNHELRVEILKNGSVVSSTTKTIQFSSSTGTKVDNDYYWKPIVLDVPLNATMQDTAKGNTYKVRLTARATSGGSSTDYKDFDLTIETPVNLNVIDHPSEMVVNDLSYNFKATTSKYVNTVQIIAYKGTSYQTTLNMVGVQNGRTKEWSFSNYVIPANIPEGYYTFEYIARTPNLNQESAIVQSYVLEAYIRPSVHHTDAWNQHRIEYNRKITGTDDSPRGYHVFWAGEKFILRAETSTAHAVQVTLLETGDQVYLNPANSLNTKWEGEMWDASYENSLKDGEYTFRFVGYYNNNVTRIEDVTIEIQGIFPLGVHRVK